MQAGYKATEIQISWLIDQAVVRGDLYAYATQGEQNITVQGGANVNTISAIYNFITNQTTGGHTKDNITKRCGY